MMSRKRLFIALLTLGLGLGLALAGTAAAGTRTYSLANGSGAQLQIGGGLPLPIQITNPTATGTVFPELLIPRGQVANVVGTTTKTMQQKLQIPVGVLSKVPAQKTLGQFGQNPSLYAVATNLGFVWPASPAILSTGARTGAKTTTFITGLGNNIRYSNTLASKFGGPARFALAPGPGAGKYPAVPVTLFAIAVPTGGVGNPPCTHPALGGANAACVAGLAQALPTGLAAAGGPVNNAVTTPGGTPLALLSTAVGAMTVPTGVSTWAGTKKNGPGPKPGVGIGKFGTNGTVSFFAFTTTMAQGARRGGTNMASSRGFPFTTGMLTISAPGALGAPEVFTITGSDGRNATGSGVIQLVSGSLSHRTSSGPNANRGWVRLVLGFGPQPVPALSPPALAATAALMLLAAGYAMRRRFSA